MRSLSRNFKVGFFNAFPACTVRLRVEVGDLSDLRLPCHSNRIGCCLQRTVSGVNYERSEMAALARLCVASHLNGLPDTASHSCATHCAAAA